MNPYEKNKIRPNETMSADFFLFFNIKFVITNKIVIVIIIIDIGENKSWNFTTPMLWENKNIVVNNPNRNGWRTNGFLNDSIESNIQHRYVIVVFLILFVIGTFYFIKTPRRLDNATKITNAIGIVIILISLSNIAIYSIEGNSFTNDFSTDNQIITTNNKVNLPDVYYIILDAYAGTEALENVFNFDNSEFYDFLTENGFYVAKKSHSNYPQSYQSLSSSLNMEYVNHIDSASLQKRQDIAYKMIENNNVMKNFKSKGYTIININSDWGPTRELPIADINLCTKYRGIVDSELFSMLINKSMLNPIYVKIFEDDRRELLLCHFSTLVEVSKITDEPFFVFAHITIPHHPYVFGPNGEKVTPKSLQLGYAVKDKEGYIGQLQYTNKLVQETIEKILAENTNSPIIIIQGDHGSDLSELGWETHDDDSLRERFSILNAFLIPDKEKEIFYETVTPVNSFRILFNHIFNDEYELLEERQYTPEEHDPWKFIDVTELILQN